VRGPVGNVRLAEVAGLTKLEWQAVKPSVLPLLLRSAEPTPHAGAVHKFTDVQNQLKAAHRRVYKEMQAA